MSNNPITLNGLSIDLKVNKIIRKNKLFKINKISKEPLISIYKKTIGDAKPPVYETPTTFVVNIFCYLPKTLNVLDESDVPNKITLISNYVYLQYNGPINKATEIITKLPNQEITCRNLEIVYNAPENQPTFKLFQVQFEYQVLDGTPSVEAIIVRDNDVDPKIDRGTITSPLRP
jgi:hypothetical protein